MIHFVWLLSAIVLFLSSCTMDNPKKVPLTIENQSSHPICSIKIHPAGSYHLPTKNLLRRFLRLRKLPPGESITFPVEEYTYDITIKTCDGYYTGYFNTPVRLPSGVRLILNDDYLFPSES